MNPEAEYQQFESAAAALEDAAEAAESDELATAREVIRDLRGRAKDLRAAGQCLSVQELQDLNRNTLERNMPSWTSSTSFNDK